MLSIGPRQQSRRLCPVSAVSPGMAIARNGMTTCCRAIVLDDADANAALIAGTVVCKGRRACDQAEQKAGLETAITTTGAWRCAECDGDGPGAA